MEESSPIPTLREFLAMHMPQDVYEDMLEEDDDPRLIPWRKKYKVIVEIIQLMNDNHNTWQTNLCHCQFDDFLDITQFQPYTCKKCQRGIVY